jgi:hypothetical protein
VTVVAAAVSGLFMYVPILVIWKFLQHVLVMHEVDSNDAHMLYRWRPFKSSPRPRPRSPFGSCFVLSAQLRCLKIHGSMLTFQSTKVCRWLFYLVLLSYRADDHDG